MAGTTSLALDSNGHRALIFNIKSKNLKTFFGLLQGIALIGGGMIINLISSIPLLCMLLRVRQLSSIIFSLIDIHPNHTHFFKIALAAASCLRSLTGFGFPLFASVIFSKLGYGKGCTILACLATILGCPAYVPSHLLVF